MTTPRQTLQADLKTALKAGEKEKVSTLRLLLTALDNERIRSGEEVTEPVFLGLVRKAIKQRSESAAQYRQGGREELAAREEREAAFLEDYLPPGADEGEIRDAIRGFVAERGLSGPGAMGPVMKEMLARFAGRTDGGTLSRLAKEVLSS